MTIPYRKISWLISLCYCTSSVAQEPLNTDFNVLLDHKIQTMVGEVIDGKQNGIWCIYEDSILTLESRYVKGVADGQWIWYYPNGTIETIAKYEMGYKKGKQVSYFENGNKRSEGNYHGEDRDGVWCDYTLTDPSYTLSTYKKGQLHGNYKKYDENGTLRESGDFKYNVKSGTWNYFDAMVNHTKTEKFE